MSHVLPHPDGPLALRSPDFCFYLTETEAEANGTTQHRSLTDRLLRDTFVRWKILDCTNFEAKKIKLSLKYEESFLFIDSIDFVLIITIKRDDLGASQR